MANYLQDLAGGLRAAAGVLNPAIQQQNFQSDERQKQVIEQRRNLILQQAIKAVESGAMQPEQFKALAQKLGFGDIAAGPDSATQARTEEVRRRREYEEAAKGAGGDLEKLAPIAAAYKPELGAAMYNAQAQRESAIESRAAALAQRQEAAQQRHEFNMQRLTNDKDKIAETQRHNQSMEAFRQEGLSLRRALGARGGGGGGRPMTDVGRLNADLQAGRITQEQYDAEITKRGGAEARRADKAAAEDSSISGIRARITKMSQAVQSNNFVVGPLGAVGRVGETALGMVKPSAETPALDYQNDLRLLLADIRKIVEKDPNLSNEERRNLYETLGGGTFQTPGSAVRALSSVLNYVEGKKVTGASRGAISRPKSQPEFNALPSGTLYIDPDDGRQYRKP